VDWRKARADFWTGIHIIINESDQGRWRGGADGEACGNISTIVLFVNGEEQAAAREGPPPAFGHLP